MESGPSNGTIPVEPEEKRGAARSLTRLIPDRDQEPSARLVASGGGFISQIGRDAASRQTHRLYLNLRLSYSGKLAGGPMR